MSTDLNFYDTAEALIETRESNGTTWAKLRLYGPRNAAETRHRHSTTFFIKDAEFGRYTRAAEAFNASRTGPDYLASVEAARAEIARITGLLKEAYEALEAEDTTFHDDLLNRIEPVVYPPVVVAAPTAPTLIATE